MPEKPYTPRSIELMDYLFYDDSELLSGNAPVKTLYDPACGTGGMLTVAEEYLRRLNSDAQLVCFGQEINPQTYAICKSDILIKGANADYIKEANTLSEDMFAEDKFDYILSNPPSAGNGRTKKAKVEAETKRVRRKVGPGLPAVGDSHMLFCLQLCLK